jgi:hypothetical protein
METQIYRNTDPDTSKDAGEEFTRTGRRQERLQQVLALVKANPGRTANELARMMVLTHPELGIVNAVYTPNKRLPDLENRGLVYKGGKRACNESGRKCYVWYAA